MRFSRLRSFWEFLSLSRKAGSAATMGDLFGAIQHVLHGKMMNKKLAAIRHVALDMDGTIYRGYSLFESTDPFLSLMKELGIGYTFLTNNPSKSVTDYLEHLRDVGITATQLQLYTSTQATIEYLREEWPQINRIFALGTPSMCEEFAEAGFVLTPDSPTAEPDAVIVGFDRTLTYDRLCRAAWWIS